MHAQEIPRQEWVRFCNDYSRQHDGWLASVRVKGGSVVDHVEAESMPFRGVSYEEKGTEKDSIAIFLNKGNKEDETHIISHPTRLRQEVDDGRDRGLEIEARDGTTTLIRFKNPSVPEMVDRM
ncbi:MAG: DUF5335 family protein [Chloroflexi bacterium]|nr:DUF5335 family protein [Chloroflexota bacterium]